MVFFPSWQKPKQTNKRINSTLILGASEADDTLEAIVLTLNDCFKTETNLDVEKRRGLKLANSSSWSFLKLDHRSIEEDARGWARVRPRRPGTLT